MSIRLSLREYEVLFLLRDGHRQKAIADKLGITVNTVKRHLTNIFDKTGCEGSTQLIAWYYTRHRTESIADLRAQIAGCEAMIREIEAEVA